MAVGDLADGQVTAPRRPRPRAGRGPGAATARRPSRRGRLLGASGIAITSSAVRVTAHGGTVDSAGSDCLVSKIGRGTLPRYGNSGKGQQASARTKGVAWQSVFRSAGSASPPASTGSSRRRPCPARASSPQAFWDGAGRDRPRPRAAQPRAARPARRAAGPHRRLAPRAPRHARRGELHRLPARDRLPARRARRRRGHHDRRRRRGGPHRRPAAGRPAAQRAVRHQRRERSLGLALRRPLRLRRRPAARATSRPATTTTRSAATRSSPAAGPSSTSTSRSPPARTPTPRRTPWTTRGSP